LRIQNWNKFSLKDPDTDRSSTLQKRFSNQNSRQRSLASNSSNNVYRKRCQWSLPGILVAESFLQSTWAICVWIFQGKLVSIFFRILYYFCHSRQLPWWSVFCCYLLLYQLGKSISFSWFKFKNCKPSHLRSHNFTRV
jgi:hypothetical protein